MLAVFARNLFYPFASAMRFRESVPEILARHNLKPFSQSEVRAIKRQTILSELNTFFGTGLRTRLFQKLSFIVKVRERYPWLSSVLILVYGLLFVFKLLNAICAALIGVSVGLIEKIPTDSLFVFLVVYIAAVSITFFHGPWECFWTRTAWYNPHYQNPRSMFNDAAEIGIPSEVRSVACALDTEDDILLEVEYTETDPLLCVKRKGFLKRRYRIAHWKNSWEARINRIS